MSLPEGPVTILGIPYRVVRCDRVDHDDPGYTWKIDRTALEIRIRSDIVSDVARQYVMGAILLEARQLLSPDHKVDDNQDTAFACVLAGTLRTNQHLLAYACGRTDTRPAELKMLGCRWSVQEVPVIPGQSSDVAGQIFYHSQTIYIRSDTLPPRKRWILLHEWSHAVADMAALSLRDDEAYIRAASTTVFDACVHNPEFMMSLLEA